jgi:hypothetical protein
MLYMLFQNITIIEKKLNSLANSNNISIDVLHSIKIQRMHLKM